MMSIPQNSVWILSLFFGLYYEKQLFLPLFNWLCIFILLPIKKKNHSINFQKESSINYNIKLLNPFIDCKWGDMTTDFWRRKQKLVLGRISEIGVNAYSKQNGTSEDQQV